jgi:hypothetical protein
VGQLVSGQPFIHFSRAGGAMGREGPSVAAFGHPSRPHGRPPDRAYGGAAAP